MKRFIITLCITMFFLFTSLYGQNNPVQDAINRIDNNTHSITIICSSVEEYKKVLVLISEHCNKLDRQDIDFSFKVDKRIIANAPTKILLTFYA